MGGSADEGDIDEGEEADANQSDDADAEGGSDRDDDELGDGTTGLPAVEPVVGADGHRHFPRTCTLPHFTELRMRSVNRKFSLEPLFVNDSYHSKVKRMLHTQTAQVASNKAASLCPQAVYSRIHATACSAGVGLTANALGPQLRPLLGIDELFTDHVGSHVVGSKSYWQERFHELVAVCMEYSTPRYFVTFTCAESDSSDYAAATHGLHHTHDPVHATEHFLHRCARPARGCSAVVSVRAFRSTLNGHGRSSRANSCHRSVPVPASLPRTSPCARRSHASPLRAIRDVRPPRPNRWEIFRHTYLAPGTNSPIGKITRLWGRHEDQVRGTLHVHAAIWVVGDDDHDDDVGPLPGIRAITCQAPRNPSNPAELAFRNAVLRWQTRKCYAPKCNQKNGVRIDYCRYDYPRTRTDNHMTPAYSKTAETGRYTYPCTASEDENLSPYVPEWLLAHGAAQNVMYVDGGAFLAYIAKYVSKAEPSGTVQEPNGVRLHNGTTSRQLRYATSRIVGAPEACAIALGRPMAYSPGCTTLNTLLPHKRKRALKQLKDRRDDDHTVWSDGWREKYAMRPRKHEYVLFHDYVRLYDVKPLGDLTPVERRRDPSPCLVRAADNAVRALHPRTASENARHATLRQVSLGRLSARSAGAIFEDSHFDPADGSLVAVARAKPRLVFYRMPLPQKDGTHAFCYHLLLMRTPWRSELPSSFIDPSNRSRTLHEECAQRELLGPDGEMEGAVRAEATRRRFSPKDIDVMVSGSEQYDDLSRVLRGAYADHLDSDGDEPEEDLNAEADSHAGDYLRRLEGRTLPGRAQDGPSVDAAARWTSQGDDDALLGGVTEAPDIDEFDGDDNETCYVWHEPVGDGAAARTFTLTKDQAKVYELLRGAPETKALWTFLSGVGGTGKSVILRLLIHHWRSQGLRVLVMAPTAFAAK